MKANQVKLKIEYFTLTRSTICDIFAVSNKLDKRLPLISLYFLKAFDRVDLSCLEQVCSYFVLYYLIKCTFKLVRATQLTYTCSKSTLQPPG